MRVLVCALVLAACGGSSEPTVRSGPAASPIATRQGADDVIVAQVNGRPVWGSCVAAQASGGPTPKTKQQALDECIAFELLAQEADARGLAGNPEVVDETRAALVNRVVELGFEERYQKPEDLKGVLSQFVDRNRARLDVSERRASAYARFNIALDAPADQDEHARALMAGFAAKMANEAGLTPPHLDAYAKAYFGATKVEVAVVDFFPKLGLATGYRDAVFAIDEIGRTYPEAVRTQWGWDVILLTDIQPAKTYTREEAMAEAFEEIRRGYFNAWVDQLAKTLGVEVTRDDKAIAKLDEGGP